MRTFLVSYADGRRVHELNQRALFRSAAGKGIDVMRPCGPSDLDAAFRARHRHILEERRGAGYWLWKPYVIRDCLRRAAEGDVVLYLDAGVLVRRPLGPLLREAQRRHLLLLRNVHRNGVYTKRDCFVLTGTDVPACHQAFQLDASVLAIENTDADRRFVDTWLELCADDRILTDRANQCGRPNLPEFRAHRYDQAVLSVLHWRERDRLPHRICERDEVVPYFDHHRRRMAVPMLVWRYAPRGLLVAAAAGKRALRRGYGWLRGPAGARAPRRGKGSDPEDRREV